MGFSLEPSGPVWLQSLMGNDLFWSDVKSALFCDDEVTDATLENFKVLNQLTELSVMKSANITDVGLENLKGLTKLETSRLKGGTRITDAGLKHFLKGSGKLQSLSLGGTGITDAGLEDSHWDEPTS